MLNFLLSLSLSMQFLSASGEEAGEHATRKNVIHSHLKSLPTEFLTEKQYPISQYTLQFKEGKYVQVERITMENSFGSTKETQIFLEENNQYTLISSHEWTDNNLLTEVVATYSDSFEASANCTKAK